MNPPVLQLEDFFLTKLAMDYTFPSNAPVIDVASINSQFNYDVLSHRDDPRRRQLKLHVIFQELDEKEQPVGYQIACEMVGFFAFTDATPKGKEELVIRVNGFNILYGTLRGLLTTTTAVFPGGRFSMPNVMPNEIVEDVERRRQEAAKNAASAPVAAPDQSAKPATGS